MKTEENTAFLSLVITLEDMGEVKELLGVLDCIEGDVPPFLNRLYHRCKDITGVPMSGRYHGTISRTR